MLIRVTGEKNGPAFHQQLAGGRPRTLLGAGPAARVPLAPCEEWGEEWGENRSFQLLRSLINSHYPPPGTCQRPRVTYLTELEEDPEPGFVGALVPDFRSLALAWPRFRAPAVLWGRKKNLLKLGQKMPFSFCPHSPIVWRENHRHLHIPGSEPQPSDLRASPPAAAETSSALAPHSLPVCIVLS